MNQASSDATGINRNTRNTQAGNDHDARQDSDTGRSQSTQQPAPTVSVDSDRQTIRQPALFFPPQQKPTSQFIPGALPGQLAASQPVLRGLEAAESAHGSGNGQTDASGNLALQAPGLTSCEQAAMITGESSLEQGIAPCTVQAALDQDYRNEVRTRDVIDVSAQKCGWDVTSPPRAIDGKLPESRYIEVKGRAKGQSTITVTRNEILYGLNQQDKFILAIVVVDGDQHEGPFYVTTPFTQEPDWAVTSIKPMTVCTALQLINRFFAEDDFDHDTQFCLHWFEGQGWAEGKSGDADVLARAKGTSVGGLHDSGVVESGAGKLRLLRWVELPKDWSPETDTRTPIWEALHHMIRSLNQDCESAAGALLARMPARAEPMRSLAYRLYTLCERKAWAEEARAYNELVSAWSSIEQASADARIVGSQALLDI